MVLLHHRCDATGDCNYRRLIVVPLEGSSDYRNRITAHELGHAFGFLEHLTSQKRVYHGVVCVDYPR